MNSALYRTRALLTKLFGLVDTELVLQGDFDIVAKAGNAVRIVESDLEGHNSSATQGGFFDTFIDAIVIVAETPDNVDAAVNHARALL